jgi:hypothetical protein
MRIHRVDAAFVKEVKEMGYEDLTVDRLVRMKIHSRDWLPRKKAQK